MLQTWYLLYLDKMMQIMLAASGKSLLFLCGESKFFCRLSSVMPVHIRYCHFNPIVVGLFDSTILVGGGGVTEVTGDRAVSFHYWFS